MKINQLPKDSEVKLTIITADGKALSLNSVVIGSIEKVTKGIYCSCIKPIYYKGNRLEFEDVTIEAEIINKDNKKSYKYTNVIIRTLVFNNEATLCLFSNEDI